MKHIGIYIYVKKSKDKDFSYTIYNLKTKQVIISRIVKNTNSLQCGYIGSCHALFLFKDTQPIYIPDNCVVSWIRKRKYNSKTNSHAEIERCNNFLSKINFFPKFFLYDNNIFEKIKITFKKEIKTERKTATELFDKSIILEKHKNSNLVCYTDGSGDNMDKTAPIEFSFVIYENDTILQTNKSICNDKENTTIKAEIMGINLCLNFLLTENLQNETITLFSDAKWVVDWICNKLTWNSKSTDSPYYNSYLELRKLIPQFQNIEFIWIPRDFNSVADGLMRN